MDPIIKLAAQGLGGIGLAAVIILFVWTLRHILKVFTEQSAAFTEEIRLARKEYRDELATERAFHRETTLRISQERRADVVVHNTPPTTEGDG